MNLNKDERIAFLKCTEELNELSVELLHSVNKRNKNNQKEILQEIKDVEKYLVIIKSKCKNTE